MRFISCQTFFSFLRYSNFCLDFFVNVGKQLDKKAMVKFKIYDVTYWETNSYITHILQYFKK